jgi:hypothetical protein
MSDLATRLREIQERCKDASPGPWKAANNLIYAYGPHEDKSGPSVHYFKPLRTMGSDATFIANARDDVPFLLAEIDRLRAIEQRAKELQKRNRAFDGRVKTEPGRTSVRDCLAVCDYILEGEQP